MNTTPEEFALDAQTHNDAIAMRFNAGKPRLSYLLTFAGGVELAWPDRPELVPLAQWYRGEHEDTEAAVAGIITQLPTNWPTLLARVCEFGASKYSRGNYLKGRSLSDTCDSLLRHIERSEIEDVDTDSRCAHAGHIAWNCLYLLHCARTMPQYDDRLRWWSAARGRSPDLSAP